MKFNCISLLFHFSFFFFFVLFLILNSFSQTFGFEKTVAPLYFKIFFSPSLSHSISLFLSFLLSLSFLHHLHSCIQFFSLVFHFSLFFIRVFYIFFFVVVVACHLSYLLLIICTITRSLASRIFRTTHFVFFLLLLNRSSVIKI